MVVLFGGSLIGYIESNGRESYYCKGTDDNECTVYGCLFVVEETIANKQVQC